MIDNKLYENMAKAIQDARGSQVLNLDENEPFANGSVLFYLACVAVAALRIDRKLSGVPLNIHQDFVQRIRLCLQGTALGDPYGAGRYPKIGKLQEDFEKLYDSLDSLDSLF